MANYPELKGKVALVSGAVGNLGTAMVQRLAAEGMRLAVVDRAQDKLDALVGSLSVDSMTAVADITKKAEVEKLVADVVAKFGQLDALINIAGGFRMGDFTALDETTFDFMMNLNARSVFLMSGAAAKAMSDKGTRGRIVTVASRSALKGESGLAAYGASKAVAIRLTEALAAEMLDKGITVNAVMPSVIDTPQNRAGGASEEEAAKWVKPESIADVIAFLLSDSARDISGASIPIYGRA